MAISWNLPALVNKIAQDVPFINTLLKALVKWAPETATTTDLPTDAKRLASVTGGVQVQKYTSQGSWTSVGKLMHDADKLDSYDALSGDPAASGAVVANYANKIPVRNSNGELPGNITGNAPTATSAGTLSAKLPISKGGTNATTAQAARESLGTHNAANITAGTLAIARGGTGRSDGFSQDVVFPLTGSAFTSAKALGQLGLTIPTKNAVDCNSLTQMGRYNCTNATVTLNYPFTGQQMVEVTGDSTCLVQRTSARDNRHVWRRTSTNGGSAWTGWTPDNYVVNSTMYIYLSKTGSDLNTGMDNAHPVLTVARAMQVAQNLKIYGDLILCFGQGEWGSVVLDGTAVPCNGIIIANYNASSKTTKADYEALETSSTAINQPPAFTSLDLRCGLFATRNIRVVKLNLYNARLNSTKFCKISQINSYQSFVSISAGFTCTYHANVGENSFIYLWNSVFHLNNATYYFDTTENNVPQNRAFIEVFDGADIIVATSTSFSGTFAGKKFIFNAGASVRLGKAPTSWPGSQAGTGEWSENGTATLAKRVQNTPAGTTWVAGATAGKALVTSNAAFFGAIFNAPTKTRRVALGTFPNTNDSVYLYSVTLDDIANEANNIDKSLVWNAASGELTATKFTGELNGNAKTATKATQDGGGKVIADTYLPKSGGTVTGTLILSKATGLSGTANNKPALIVGGTDTQAHLELDNNEIQAKKDGTSVADLHLNHDGGSVFINNKRAVFGASKGSATKPVYSDANGELQSSDANVGNVNTPIFLKAGVMTPCSDLSSTLSMVPNGGWQERYNGTTYTAESNGWVYGRNSKYKTCGTTTRLVVNGIDYWLQSSSYGSWSCANDQVIVAPVKKGQWYRPDNLDSCGFISAS